MEAGKIFCPNCGMDFQVSFNFCPKCGFHIEDIKNKLNDSLKPDAQDNLNSSTQAEVIAPHIMSEDEQIAHSVGLPFMKNSSKQSFMFCPKCRTKLKNNYCPQCELNAEVIRTEIDDNNTQQHNNMGVETNNNTIHDTQPDNKLPQENTSQQTKQSTESTEGTYRNSSQQPPVLPRNKRSAVCQEPRPWVRFWARTLDLCLLYFVTGFMFGLLFPEFTNRMIKAGSPFAFGFFILPFVVIFEALIIACFENTPAKAILKTKITNPEGNSLSFVEALKRSFYIYFVGYAMGIPLISFATYFLQYKKLKKDKKTSWDNKYNLSVVHSHIGGLRITAYVGLCLVASFAISIGKITSNGYYHPSQRQDTVPDGYKEFTDTTAEAKRLKPPDLQTQPDSAEAWYDSANSYYSLGRYQEAMEAYKQAIKLKPDNADAHHNLGLTYDRLGRYQEGMEAYNQAIKLKPD